MFLEDHFVALFSSVTLQRLFVDWQGTVVCVCVCVCKREEKERGGRR